MALNDLNYLSLPTFIKNHHNKFKSLGTFKRGHSESQEKILR